MSKDVRRECERLFMAVVPFVQAEQEAQKALDAARAALKAYSRAAVVARAAWVDFLLTHEHETVCRSDEAALASEPR